MLQRTLLYQREILAVRHVSCCVTHSGPSEVESPQEDGIVLPFRGAFMQHVSPKRAVLADSNHAMFFAEGVPHRISHPVSDRDECLAVDFAPGVLREVLIGEAVVERLSDLGTHAVLPPRMVAARSLLTKRLSRGTASELEVEETFMEITRVAIRAARRKKVRPQASRPQHDVVRFTLLDQPEEKWTLAALAKRANSSAYHLARTFRRDTGLSIHEYQLRARLARAIDLLLDTTHDLTWIAHELGFATHSHFTAVFHRMVGVVPSDYRRSASVRRASESRTLLIAAPPA